MTVVDTRQDLRAPLANLSPRRRAWRRFLRNRAGLAGLIVLTAVTISALLAPWIVPFPEDATGASHMDQRLLSPSYPFWFGTDQLGRDVFSRAVYGGRVSLTIGVLSVLFSAIIGSLAGLVAGYRSGWTDDFIMRLADIFLGIPALVLAMLVALTFGGGAEVAIIAIAVTWWPRYARLIRGEVLRIKVQEYVEAARALGASSPWLLQRHIFPATLPVLTVQASLHMGQAILVAAALGFIGLGAHPPSPEWGLSVAIGREYLPDSWWISFFPGAIIVLTVVSLNLIGDGLRAALDAKTEQAL